MRQWTMLFSDKEYQRVAYTEIGPYHVSTVWLGLNHSFGNGSPIIFETMVFSNEQSWAEWPDGGGFWYYEDLDQRRYYTEEEAMNGHEQICEEVRLTLEAMSDVDPRDTSRLEEE